MPVRGFESHQSHMRNLNNFRNFLFSRVDEYAARKYYDVNKELILSGFNNPQFVALIEGGLSNPEQLGILITGYMLRANE